VDCSKYRRLTKADNDWLMMMMMCCDLKPTSYLWDGIDSFGCVGFRAVKQDFCSFYTQFTPPTRLDLSRLVGGVNWVGDSRRQFSVVLNILATEQFCRVSSAVWTHLSTSIEPVSKYDVTICHHSYITYTDPITPRSAVPHFTDPSRKCICIITALNWCHTAYSTLCCQHCERCQYYYARQIPALTNHTDIKIWENRLW